MSRSACRATIPSGQQHPEVRGAAGAFAHGRMAGDLRLLHVDAAEMRAWLREVTANLFRAIPDLGGWFAITASEHHTHCYSHIVDIPGGEPDCPRCAERTAMDVVAEVITDAA